MRLGGAHLRCVERALFNANRREVPGTNTDNITLQEKILTVEECLLLESMDSSEELMVHVGGFSSPSTIHHAVIDKESLHLKRGSFFVTGGAAEGPQGLPGAGEAAWTPEGTRRAPESGHDNGRAEGCC